MAGGADERRQTVALLHVVRPGVLRPGRTARDAENHEPSRRKPHCHDEHLDYAVPASPLFHGFREWLH